MHSVWVYSLNLVILEQWHLLKVCKSYESSLSRGSKVYLNSQFLLFHLPQDENRYHEDIFGITLRTAEIHNKSRETAKIKMESQTKFLQTGE